MNPRLKSKILHQTERLFLLNILFWDKSWISSQIFNKKGRGEWNEHLQFVLYVPVFLFLDVKWQIWHLYLSKHELLQGLCFWCYNSCQCSLLLLDFCARKQQGKRA